jgi:hypothetical protein
MESPAGITQRHCDYSANCCSAFRRGPIHLFVLERLWDRNYSTQRALEEVTGRDLTAYCPLPPEQAMPGYLVDLEKLSTNHR